MNISSDTNIEWLGDPKTVIKYRILIPSGVALGILIFLIVFPFDTRTSNKDSTIFLVLLSVAFLILWPIILIGLSSQAVLMIGLSNSKLIIKRWLGEVVFQMEEIEHITLKRWGLTKSLLIIASDRQKHEYPFSIEFRRTGDEERLIIWWNSQNRNKNKS
jgi:hypothetical protein